MIKGVRAIADCLSRSKTEETQDCAKNLLYQLGVVNKFICLYILFLII